MSQTNAVKKKEADITDMVMKKIKVFEQSGELRLPQNYSAENALKGAQLILAEMEVNKKPVLEVCSKASIARSLFKMVSLGLSVLKKQGNFIAYGDQLSFQEEYTGNIALAKRYGGLIDIKAHVIYEGDDFEFYFAPATGITVIEKHKPSLDSLGNKSKIKGAYAIYSYTSKDTGEIITDVEVMNFEQIENSWKQGAMKGNSPAHRNFSDQMCKKTVINRACKLLIRGSDDAPLFEDDTRDFGDKVEADVDLEINENANKERLDMDQQYVDYEEVPPEPEPNTAKPEAKKQEKPKAYSQYKKEKEAENIDAEGNPRMF